MRPRVLITITATLLWAGTATAQPPPATSLNTCQSTVRTAARTYLTNYTNAVGTCLQAVAGKVVKADLPLTAAVASTCVTQFRKLSDSRALGKSLSEKLALAVGKKCTPGMLNVTHGEADVSDSFGGSITVPPSQRLQYDNLNTWCTQFGGDGSLNTPAELTACIAASHACAAQQAIVTQYPRALEWLAAIRALMVTLTPPASDPTRISDAVSGLDAVVAAIDGPDGNGQPNIRCGAGGLPATGETTSYGPGSDGAVQAGAPLSYRDNGDGTITDNTTGLMWEKKSDDGSIHDKDNFYSWGITSPPYTMNGTMVTTFLDTLNDVAGGGASCFADHCDWRIPNIKELHSLADFSTSNPALNAVFNTSCAPTCTVLTCSCVAADFYWSSTSVALLPNSAWVFYSLNGTVLNGTKSSSLYVRAVRGGS